MISANNNEVELKIIKFEQKLEFLFLIMQFFSSINQTIIVNFYLKFVYEAY